MAFVVRRPGERFEIRESAATPLGPRARTLVTFRELTDEVLDTATERSSGPLDRARLRARAIELGAAVGPPTIQNAAHEVLKAHGRGERLPAATLSLLRHMLGDIQKGEEPGPPSDHLDAMLPWLGATDQQRATALVDLLGLVDALPAPRRRELRFPRLEAR